MKHRPLRWGSRLQFGPGFLFLIFTFQLFFSGCWKSEVKPPSYRKVSSVCAQLHLQSKTLDAAALRSLTQCIHSNFDLGPIIQLLNGPDGLTDAELDAFAHGIQKYVLENPTRFREMDQSLHLLKKQDRFQSTLRTLAVLLEDPEPLVEILAFLRTHYLASVRAHSRTSETVAKIVSEQLTEKRGANLLDLALTFTNSRIFRQLNPQASPIFASVSAQTPSRVILESVFQYLKRSHTFDCEGNSVPIKRELLQSVQDGSLFGWSDQVLGRTEFEIQNRIPQVVALLGESLQPTSTSPQASILEALASTLHSLDGEISCLKGSNRIPNGALYLFRELGHRASGVSPTDYILRELPLTLASLKPFCEYPPGLAENYPAVTQLARTGAMEAMAPMLQAAYSIEKPALGCPGRPPREGERDHPLAQFLIHFLADQDGIKLLLPALQEMVQNPEAHAVTQEGLLLLTLPRPEMRQGLQELLAAGVQPREELNQRSLMDLGLDVLTSTDFETFYNLLIHLENLTRGHRDQWGPALFSLRNFLHLNNVHPILELAKDVLADASENQALFESFFNATQNPHFKDSLVFTAEMAKDGRLADLSWTLLDLLHSLSNRSASHAKIRELEVPAWSTGARHDLSQKDLSPFHFNPAVAQGVSPQCDAIDLSFSLGDTSQVQFDDELRKMILCQNGAGTANDVTNALQFLRQNSTENGESFIHFQIDLLKRHLGDLTRPELQIITDGWKKSLDRGQFTRLLNAVPLWVRGLNGQPVLRPLLDVVGVVLQNGRSAFERLEQFVGTLLEKPAAPFILGDLDDVLRSSAPTDSPSPLDRVFTPTFKGRIRKWIEFKECLQGERLEARVTEVLNEPRTLMTNWDRRSNWTLSGAQGLKAMLEPALQKLGTPAQSLPTKPLLDSVLTFLRYFKPGDPLAQYDIPYLIQWIHQRSLDYRLITYYYPGETTPRVRIVNTLDLLEITLSNVDFDAPPPLNKNLGLEYMEELALAWGDVPDRTRWPQEVQALYPAGQPGPRTLAQAVEDVTNRPFDPATEPGFDNLDQLIHLYVGLPQFPSCYQAVPGETADPQAPTGGAQYFMTPEQVWDFQVRLYNITQALSVLKENTPGSGVGYSGGLEVLRNLLYEVHSSTPLALRTPTAGDQNNLSLILKMIRLGVLRQVGGIVQKFEAHDPALTDFFQTIVRASGNPHLREILVYLLETDAPHSLIWEVFKSVFDLFENGTREEIADLKDLGFYSLAWVNRFPQPSLLDTILAEVKPVVTQNGTFFGTHGEIFQDLFRLSAPARITRGSYAYPNSDRDARFAALLESVFTVPPPTAGPTTFESAVEVLKLIYGHPSAQTPWRTFVQRARELTRSSAYQNLELSEALHPLVQFFAHRENDQSVLPTASENALADKLRLRGAQILKNRELDQFLILAKNHPDDFQQLLETLSRLMGSGDQGKIKEFMQMVRRSLGP